MAKFFRVEHESGHGPFQYLWRHVMRVREDDAILIDLLHTSIDLKTHPDPHSDFTHEHRQAYVYGCDSLETLSNWFSKKVIDHMAKMNDFCVMVYEVEAIQIGHSGTQIRAFRDDLKESDILDIRELLAV